MTRDDLEAGSIEGVFRFKPPMPIGADPVTGSARVRVATANLRDKAAFLNACSSALAFPEHFGHNWDAFYDCLSDLAQRFSSGLVIVFENLSDFARLEPEEFNAAVDAMIDASEYWREHQAKLTVLVGIDQPVLAPELREFSPRRPE